MCAGPSCFLSSGDGCVGNFLSCRNGVKDPLEVPGKGKAYPARKIKHSQKEINKIIFTILKMCKSEDKSFQVPPPSPPLPSLKNRKASPLPIYSPPLRTRTPTPVLVSNLQFLLACGNWLTPFDKQLSRKSFLILSPKTASLELALWLFVPLCRSQPP